MIRRRLSFICELGHFFPFMMQHFILKWRRRKGMARCSAHHAHLSHSPSFFLHFKPFTLTPAAGFLDFWHLNTRKRREGPLLIFVMTFLGLLRCRLMWMFIFSMFSPKANDFLALNPMYFSFFFFYVKTSMSLIRLLWSCSVCSHKRFLKTVFGVVGDLLYGCVLYLQVLSRMRISSTLRGQWTRWETWRSSTRSFGWRMRRWSAPLSTSWRRQPLEAVTRNSNQNMWVNVPAGPLLPLTVSHK